MRHKQLYICPLLARAIVSVHPAWRRLETIAMAILMIAAYSSLALGQSMQTTLLRIDIQDYVPYHYDVFDNQKFGTAPVLTPYLPSRGAFDFFVQIGDIVAVNGKPVKGLWT